MRAAGFGADPDHVAASCDVGDGEPEVGERAVHRRDPALDLLERLGSGAGESELMLDDVGRAKLVHDIGVAGGEPFMQHPLDDLSGCGRR
jgi:hypothetical protein